MPLGNIDPSSVCINLMYIIVTPRMSKAFIYLNVLLLKQLLLVLENKIR